MPKLIIFVDALPFELKDDFLGIFDSLNFVTKLQPELGYSSNQHMALFAGKLPKDIGYLGDYSLDRENKVFKSILTHNNPINYIYRKLEAKITSNNANIPLGMKDVFINNGYYPLASKDNLTKVNIKYDKYDFKLPCINKEIEFLQNLIEESEKIEPYTFICLNSIDHIGHIKGTASKYYKRHLNKLLHKVNQLIKNFITKYGESDIILLSDHGMSNAPKKVSINLESQFGPQSNNTYVYFVDSSVLKVWCADSALKSKIKNYLASLEYGVCLDDEQLDHYGVDSNIADLVFVVKSNFFIEPQYFGFGLKSKVMGMHGALPTCSDQFGILLSNFNTGSCTLRNSKVFTEVLEKREFV
ncbi:alkaline phosphatase family protein [Vibrio vulnificus]|uniref:alkaline phosphatase family protein n=2 Tax=Vibrio vulnificus TaxID=672 RepID=UPI003D9C8DF1